MIVATGSAATSSSRPKSSYSKQLCLSFDIDGTVANISERLAYAEKRAGNTTSAQYWNILLSGSLYDMDTPIPNVKAFMDTWKASEDPDDVCRNFVYLSGRRSGTENQTKAWLKKFGFPDGMIIHRPKGQKSMEWKAAELTKLKSEFTVVAHFGDRDDDVNAAKRAKIWGIRVEENKWLDEKELRTADAVNGRASAGVNFEKADNMWNRGLLFGGTHTSSDSKRQFQ